MCKRRVDTVRAAFAIASDDLGAVLRLAARDGITSTDLYRMAVAEYLINHAPAAWWEHAWPVGNATTSEDHGSAPTDVTP